jgi:PAS domain-containing protein
VTDQQAEEALHPKEAELQRVADAPIVLARLSRDLRHVFVNAALVGMFGLPAEEIVGKPIAEVMGRGAFETIRPYVERVLLGRRSNKRPKSRTRELASESSK